MRPSIRSVFVFVVCFITAVAVQAQATRTWVSGVGDDANPCSRTAPCKTFAGAISKTAAGGEISVLDPGGYGAVTITKAITIDGAGTLASILASGTNGVNVAAGVNDVVTLRNLTINGGTPTAPGVNGVRMTSGKALRIENCEIFGFSNRGITVETSTNVALAVVDTIIRESGVYGAVVIASSGSPVMKGVFDNVRVIGGANGIYFGNNSLGSVQNSSITGLTGTAVFADESTGTTEVTIANTVVSQNNIGLRAGNGASEIRISNTQVTNNTTNGFLFLGGTIVSFGNNLIRGNGGVTNTPTSTPGQT